MANVSILPEGGRHLYLGGVTGRQTIDGQRTDAIGGQAGLGIDLVRIGLDDDDYGTKITVAPEISFAGTGTFKDHQDFVGMAGTLRYGGAVGISGGNDALRLEALGGAERREGTAAYVGGRLSVGRFNVAGTTGGLFLQGDTTIGNGHSGDWSVGLGYVARF